MKKRTTQWRPRAQNAALTRLTHEFWNRYRELLDEEYEFRTAVRPQSRARTRLSQEHRERYRQLYAEECDRLLALPEEERFSVRPKYAHIRPEYSKRAKNGAA